MTRSKTKPTTRTANFDSRMARAIPAEFFMISGCSDSQQGADAKSIGEFELPARAGKAGGASTSALLTILYQQHRLMQNHPQRRRNKQKQPLTWVQLLHELRESLKERGYTQIPQLTGSRWIDINKPLYLVPPTHQKGKRRAILIGINYVGQGKVELSGCHNDVHHVKQYLVDCQGFDENAEFMVLMDDGQHPPPTHANIRHAFWWISQVSQPGDVAVIQYSGHGSQVHDWNGDEEDGYDETLIPVDFRTAGQIVDDEILKTLVKPMRAGVHVTALIDCCHSGTVLDLPYLYKADEGDRMDVDPKFNESNFLQKMGNKRAQLMAGLRGCMQTSVASK